MIKTLFLSLLIWALPGTDNAIITGISSRAKDNHKLIAVYFSGSDWCSNCHQFNKEVLSDSEIAQLLASRFVYYTADFPQRKKLAIETKTANEFLAEKLNPNGEFPVLVIADNNMNAVARIHKGPARGEVLEKLKELQSRTND